MTFRGESWVSKHGRAHTPICFAFQAGRFDDAYEYQRKVLVRYPDMVRRK